MTLREVSREYYFEKSTQKSNPTMKTHVLSFAASILAAFAMPMTLAVAADSPSSPTTAMNTTTTPGVAQPMPMMAVPMMPVMMNGGMMGASNRPMTQGSGQPVAMMGMGMPMCCPMCMQMMMSGGMMSGGGMMGAQNAASVSSPAQAAPMMGMPMMMMPMMNGAPAAANVAVPSAGVTATGNSTATGPAAPTPDADPHAGHH
jgi:hypothetical protein